MRVALAGVLVLVTAGAAAAGPPRVVPWLDQRPAKAAAHPPLAPPCRAADLRAHLFLQGATGSLVGGITLRNAGSSACSLVGLPDVSFTGAAARNERWRVKALAATAVPRDVLADPPGSLRALQPGTSAGITVWWSNWCGAPPAGIALSLASRTTVSVPVAGAPRCDMPTSPSTVAITPFAPAQRSLPASSRLPLRVAIVGRRPVAVKRGLSAFRVHRGARFRYVVAVTNTGSKPFRFARSSCPSYVEQVAPAAAQAYVLNCRAVHRIAPRATVRFAMEISIPMHAHLGNNSLTWELAPKTYDAPFAPAALWVLPARPLALRWIQMTDTAHGYALSGEDTNAYRLLSTGDGGRHWLDVTPGGGTVHPSGPLSIFGSTRLFSTRLKQGVFAVERSDDGGRTWHSSLPFRDAHGQGAGQPFALDSRHLFLAVDEGAAAGSQGQALFTSGDGGRRWRFVSRTSTSSTPRNSLPFGCDKGGFGFSTPARGWAGGYCAGGVPFFYRTDDGGRTWRRQQLPVPDQCACETTAPRFFTPTVGAVAVTGFTTNGSGQPLVRVLWTSDGGDHWRPSDVPVGRAEDVSFADAQSVWVIAQKRGNLSAPFDLLARTTDAGRHWSTTTLPFDGGRYRLDALSSRVAYGLQVADASDTIVVTADGGRTWRTIHATTG